MATDIIHDLHRDNTAAGGDEALACSVGIMAYNEEANIIRTLQALFVQTGPSVRLQEVIVVASGCTDRTIPLVAEMARTEPRILLYVQEKREGKASAINLFLKKARSPLVVLLGADVIPEKNALEHLCSPFHDPAIGMVGGCPVPVNDPSTFMGHTVHLLWRLHDRVARQHPKLGEVIAFRNVISGIPTNSAVDEISIQALISQLGYQIIYRPECVIYNKGPLTVRDFLKQRRRIYAGHLKVLKQQQYQAATMKVSPIFRQLIACRHFTMSTPRQTLWTLGAVALEAYARLQGYADYWRKREHYIWQAVASTKDLEAGEQKVRRICQAQSVIVFRLLIAGVEQSNIHHEREEHEATEAARKLLPAMHARLRKEDMLSVNGPGIITAVIRADQQGAEIVAQRMQSIVAAATVRVGVRNREVSVSMAYSVLTFAIKASDGELTITGSHAAITPTMPGQSTGEI